MLSWSARETKRDWNPRAITAPNVDSGLPGGRELIEFVDAAHGVDPRRVEGAGRALSTALGAAAVVDAAAVIGNFNQMNRLADATGMPVGRGRMRSTEGLRDAAGIVPFH